MSETIEDTRDARDAAAADMIGAGATGAAASEGGAACAGATGAATDDALLAGLTDEQRPCVERVDGALVVSAGAGSGKTYMLTRRIAYALRHPERSGVTDIDQVLAITFTTLAASEIKARVRSALRAAGMADQALKVDASWISTIHGMCSRILREHALELNLDPSFGIMDDALRGDVLRASVEEALGVGGGRRHGAGQDADDLGDGEADDARASDDAADDGAEGTPGDRRYGALFAEYDTPGRPSVVADMVERLINEAANVRGGLDAIACGPDPAPARAIATDVLDALRSIEAAVVTTGIDKKGAQKGTFVTTVLDALRGGEGGEGGLATFERLASSDDTTYRDLAAALDGFSPKFGLASGGCKEANVAFRVAYDRACLECMLGLAAPLRAQLLSLARDTQAIFERRKDELGVLDQNDLLTRTLRALEGSEALAEAYRDRFRLVMVDEFQDTSALQIAIIDMLDGRNHERLCTVGDTQQSIYRFRGADVATYRAHKRRMREEAGALDQRLTRNFRSDGDVIAFVNRVFSQPRVFGGPDSEFIPLSVPEDRESPLPADLSRVSVVDVTCAHGGATTDARHAVEAHEICRRFRGLHARGVAWGDMVILLGRMANAAVYADALRSHGVPCIIAGGSIFTHAAEAQAVRDLAACVANPLDDASLRDVLTSGMFALGADELLRLATRDNGAGGSRDRQRLWDGLRWVTAHGDPSPRVRLAAAVMLDAVAHAGSTRPSDVLRDAVLASGWLDRLQAGGPEGMAVAANVLKAIRVARSMERGSDGAHAMAAVSAELTAAFDGTLRTAPGALNGTTSDAVRVMTIHASKGLEFPVVALADFYDTASPATNLELQTSGDVVRLTLRPARSVSADRGGFGTMRDLATNDLRDQLAKAAEFVGADVVCDDPAQAESAEEFARAVRARSQADELAETRRKFYVGATRPRELLVVAFDLERTKVAAKTGAVYGNEVIEDLRRALVGETGDFPEQGPAPFGGRTPADCRRIDLRRQDGVTMVGDVTIDEYLAEPLDDADMGADNVEAGDVEETMAVPEPVRVASLVPTAMPAASVHASEFSFSSLSNAEYGEAGGGPRNETGTLAASSGTPDGSDESSEVIERDRLDVQEADPDEVAPLADAAREEAELEETGGGKGEARALAGLPGEMGAAQRRRTAFGSAFHSACEWMAERARLAPVAAPGEAGQERLRRFTMPDETRLSQLMHAWEVDEGQRDRLVAALRRWHDSSAAVEALSYPTVEPEAALFVTLIGPQGEPLHLNGSIDLFCHDALRPAASQRALIVDYKTGGTSRDTPESLHEKHLLQAHCYAYAALRQGYAGIDLRFVRVEQPVGAGSDEPQVVSYAFDADEVETIAATIRAAYGKARAARG